VFRRVAVEYSGNYAPLHPTSIVSYVGKVPLTRRFHHASIGFGGSRRAGKHLARKSCDVDSPRSRLTACTWLRRWDHAPSPTAHYLPLCWSGVRAARCPVSAPVSSVAQFRVENGGTLTALATSTTGSIFPSFAAVAPVNQYLFVPNGAISEFGIGIDGILTAAANPPLTGSSIAFTPNGQFAFIANQWNSTLSSYSLSASGGLSPINTVPTGGFPQGIAVDGGGKFAYVANSNDGTISEYTASSDGVLAANGSIPTGGYNPRALAISGGFLYCGNSNSGSVAVFSINGSTGALAFVNSYETSVQPQPGPLWISFDPAGTKAYVGDAPEIAQFRVDGTTGSLTSNGITLTPGDALWGGVDPSGRFLFTANVDGTVSQFIIGSTGALIPNGSAYLGVNMAGETLAFAQQ